MQTGGQALPTPNEDDGTTIPAEAGKNRRPDRQQLPARRQTLPPSGVTHGDDAGAAMTDCRCDDDLLADTAQGDRVAFQVLMQRHVRPMLALAQRVSGSADDAEELVQDAFLKVWAMAPKWRRDGGAQFSTWLYRVVLNGCLDRRRRPAWTGLDEVAEVADTDPGAAQHLARRQSRALIQTAMADIPERQRAALYLHYFAEITAPQAALVLDISVPAMEALLIRGKRALKKELMRRGVTDLGDML